MLHTACDLFSATGKQWLALVDRFSGYTWATALRKLDTKAIIFHLEQQPLRVSRGLSYAAQREEKTSTRP